MSNGILLLQRNRARSSHRRSTIGLGTFAATGLVALGGCAPHLEGRGEPRRVDDRAESGYDSARDDSAGSELDSSLVSHWTLNTCHGDTAYDATGSHHGTLHGPEWVTGRHGDCSLEFDGPNDWVDVGAPDELHPEQAITVTAWAMAYEVERSKHNNVIRTGDSGYEIQERSDGYWRWYVDLEDDGWTYIRDSREKVEPNRWYHIAGTYDASTGAQRLYIDGELVEEANRGNQRISYSDRNVGIGNRGFENTRNLYGRVGEASVYDRALSSDEIAELAQK